MPERRAPDRSSSGCRSAGRPASRAAAAGSRGGRRHGRHGASGRGGPALSLRTGPPHGGRRYWTWKASIAEVTDTDGGATELVQLTEPVPDWPASCSGIDAIDDWPATPVVSIVTDRVSVLEPTVSLQVTVTCWLVVTPLAGVTVAVGLANAKYEDPVGSATLVAVTAVAPTSEAVLSVVPYCWGRVWLQVTWPARSIAPIALPAAQVPLTLTCSWLVLARTIPTELGLILR